MSDFLEGGWRIISVFPDTEALVIKKLRERFQQSNNPLLTECLVAVEKPEPQENYIGNVVVVNRNGGGLSNNNLSRDDIFTIQIWGFDYNTVQTITTLTEGYFQTIYGDGIGTCTIDEPQSRIPTEGEAKARYFTGNVFVMGTSLSTN